MILEERCLRCERASKEMLRAQLGKSRGTFRLWQDQVAIAPGKEWELEIKKAVDESVFFIPIVTPRSVSSKYCKFEFESFLARERALGRNDLVFPIHYISVGALESEAKWRNDPVLSIIGRRQYVDWRRLRHLDVQMSAVQEQIELLCQRIVEALNEPWLSPEERRRLEEAKAHQQAEEETRRLEAEAKRRAEEEQRQAEARKRAEEKARVSKLADLAEADLRSLSVDSVGPRLSGPLPVAVDVFSWRWALVVGAVAAAVVLLSTIRF